MKTSTQAAKTPLSPVHGSPKMTPLKKKNPIKKKTPLKKTLKGGRRTSTRVQNQGHFDIIFPQVPTLDGCLLHYFMTRQPVPEMYKKPDLRDPFNKDLLVHIDNGLGMIAKSYAWQMEAPYLLGDMMMDSMSRILHLAERNRTDVEKRILFFPSLYSPLGQKNANSGISTLYLGDFEQMRWISLPLNVTDCHYLLMVLDFTEEKVFILDPSSNQLYNESAIKAKLIQMHRNLEISLPIQYPSFYDITKWEIVWTHPNIPRQSNEFDCGPYVCFYMEHLRELIPEPQHIIKVREDYIRIWLANYIGRSVYNDLKETLLEQCSKYKAVRANEDDFSLKYKKIPTVYSKYFT